MTTENKIRKPETRDRRIQKSRIAKGVRNPQSYMRTVVCRFDDESFDWIVAEAEKHKVSVAAIVRTCVRLCQGRNGDAHE